MFFPYLTPNHRQFTMHDPGQRNHTLKIKQKYRIYYLEMVYQFFKKKLNKIKKNLFSKEFTRTRI